jgi:hypothetical protein
MTKFMPFLLLILVLGLICQPSADAQFQIRSSVFGNGGVAIDNGTHRIASTVGQPAIGTMNNPTHTLHAGFWQIVGTIQSSTEAPSLELPLFEPPSPSDEVETQVTFSPAAVEVRLEEQFTVEVRVEDITDLAGWETQLLFNPEVLEVSGVEEGEILKSDGGNTFWQAGTIDNAQGVISGVSAAVVGTGGVSGNGTLFTITFTAKAEGESILELQNLNLGAASETPIPHQTIPGRVTVVQPEPEFLPEDINEDGVVNIFDLIAVAQSFGLPVPTNPRADVNADGTVNIFDLIAVAQNFGKSTDPAAPAVWQPLTMQHATMLEGWIRDAQGKTDGSGEFQHGIAVLEHLLNSIVPDETQIFANFPNPFNPETWIPYQLSQASDVTVTIYDVNGRVIRQLNLGFKAAGIYRTKSRSIYWDGRSETGELVSSGVYFYHLLAGDFSATRKMVIIK